MPIQRPVIAVNTSPQLNLFAGGEIIPSAVGKPKPAGEVIFKRPDPRGLLVCGVRLDDDLTDLLVAGSTNQSGSDATLKQLGSRAARWGSEAAYLTGRKAFFKLAQQRSWPLLVAPKGSPPNTPRRRYSAWQERGLFPACCVLPWRVWVGS